MRALSAALIVLSLAAAGLAQSPADALRAEPRTFTLQELPDDYRAVAIGGSGDLSPWMLFGMGGSGSSRSWERLLYRSLGAVWVQPDEFAELLDGKRPRIRGFRIDIAALAGAGSSPTPVFAETWLEAGRIIAWSPAPDLSKASLAQAMAEAERRHGTTSTAGEGVASVRAGEPAASAQPRRSASARLSDLKQIATAVQMYAADNKNRLPRTAASSGLRPLVSPYLKSSSIFSSTSEGGRVLYNTSLAGASLVSIAAPAQTLLLWEERAWPDGRRVVAFVDGHSKRVSETEWARLWQAESKRRASARANRRR